MSWEFFSVGPASAEIEKLEIELASLKGEFPKRGKIIHNIGLANERVRELRFEVEKLRGIRPSIAPRPASCPASRPSVSPDPTVASPARSTPRAAPAPESPRRPSLQEIGVVAFGETEMEVISRNLRGDDAAIDARIQVNCWRLGLHIPGEDAAGLQAKYGSRGEPRGLKRIEVSKQQKRIDQLFSGSAAQTKTPKVSRPRPVPKTAAERIREMQGR